MPHYVALLRGINVGGHRVKMDRLRALFDALDFHDVSTFIASGNVVFRTEATDEAALAASIETHLEAELGYGVPTFLRTTERLHDISELAWPDAVGQGDSDPSHYIVFLRDAAEPELRAALDSLASETDAFRYEGREVHWLTSGKVSESPLFGGALEKVMRGVPNTMRNMTSVRKMAAKYGP